MKLYLAFIMGIIVGFCICQIYDDFQNEETVNVGKKIEHSGIKEKSISKCDSNQVRRGKFNLLQEVPYFGNQVIGPHRLNNAYPLDDNGYFNSKERELNHYKFNRPESIITINKNGMIELLEFHFIYY